MHYTHSEVKTLISSLSAMMSKFIEPGPQNRGITDRTSQSLRPEIRRRLVQ